MRYTRLKKAVESGVFRGATLSQPQAVSAQMVELANPDSRRTSTLGSLSSPAGGSAVYNSTRKTPRRRNKKGSQPDLQTPTLKSKTRKRRAEDNAEDDGDGNLFFPDTSSTSQRYKQIKRSESDVEAEEVEEEEEEEEENGDLTDRTPTRSTLPPLRLALPPGRVRGLSGIPARPFYTPGDEVNTSSSLSPTSSNIDELGEADDNGNGARQNDRSGDETEELEEVEPDEASSSPSYTQRRRQRRRTSYPIRNKVPAKPESTRKKKSAREAAASALARRIANGEVVPDANNILHLAEAARLGYDGQPPASDRPVRDNTQYTANHSTQRNDAQDQNYDQTDQVSEDDDHVRSSFSQLSPGTRISTPSRRSGYSAYQRRNSSQTTNTRSRNQPGEIASRGSRYGPPRLSTTKEFSNYSTATSLLEGFEPPVKRNIPYTAAQVPYLSLL